VGHTGNKNGLVLMPLDRQKANRAALWRTEWSFGISTLAGLSAMPF
jgi:hypothetical protein